MHTKALAEGQKSCAVMEILRMPALSPVPKTSMLKRAMWSVHVGLFGLWVLLEPLDWLPRARNKMGALFWRHPGHRSCCVLLYFVTV
jgi:hypothetical protein